MITKLLTNLLGKRAERKYRGPLSDFIVERTEMSDSSELLGSFSHRIFKIFSIKSLEELPNSKHPKLIHFNDFVISLNSGFSFCLIEKQLDKKCTTYLYNNVFQIRDLEKLNPLYLKLIFESQKFQEEVSYRCQKGEKGKKKLEDFLDIEITFPSLKKQKRYIEEFQLLKEEIDNKKQTNFKLEQLINSCKNIPERDILSLLQINQKIIKSLFHIQKRYINKLS